MITDKIIELQYCAQTVQFLQRELMTCRANLQKTPGHVMWTGKAERIKNDIEIMTKIARSLELEINQHYEKQEGVKFQYLENEAKND